MTACHPLRTLGAYDENPLGSRDLAESGHCWWQCQKAAADIRRDRRNERSGWGGVIKAGGDEWSEILTMVRLDGLLRQEPSWIDDALRFGDEIDGIDLEGLRRIVTAVEGDVPRFSEKL